MKITRFYKDDGAAKYVVVDRNAADNNLKPPTLVYPTAREFKKLWDKGVDAVELPLDNPE